MERWTSADIVALSWFPKFVALVAAETRQGQQTQMPLVTFNPGFWQDVAMITPWFMCARVKPRPTICGI